MGNGLGDGNYITTSIFFFDSGFSVFYCGVSLLGPLSDYNFLWLALAFSDDVSVIHVRSLIQYVQLIQNPSFILQIAPIFLQIDSQVFANSPNMYL